jgi:hypothetical protein
LPIGTALAELRDSQLTGQLIKPARKSWRDRNAVARAGDTRLLAALAGDGDPLHARHALAATKIAHQLIYGGLVKSLPPVEGPPKPPKKN